MRQGLSNNEFFLRYQPIVSGVTGKCVAYEALVRWEHPQLGTLTPDSFIPLAEMNGFINEIGAWVLKKACADLHVLNVAKKNHALRLNINLSARELISPGFTDRLGYTLSNAGVLPGQIQLEVTESVFIQHPELANLVIENIRKSGIRVALDDFGTGFSSLSYIVNYTVDEVKIDKSFISALALNERSRIIIKSIILLCSDLSLETTAEGVENIDQQIFLKDLGCTNVQGFLISVPLSFDELIEYLE